jgi:DNA-binding NarL/FixJ family response regulator
LSDSPARCWLRSFPRRLADSVRGGFFNEWGDVGLNKLRVVVADDNAAVLRQLVSLLAGEFDVVATAEDGLLALKHICQRKPDVGVLDLKMPILDGTEVTRQVQESVPRTAIVICSVETDPEIVTAARRAGALGYVFKTHMTRDLIAAVKAAARGQSFVSGPRNP